MRRIGLLLLLAVGACARPQVAALAPAAAPPVEVQILAFNDFHGALETPPPFDVTEPGGAKREVSSGGAANLAGALAAMRRGQPHTVTVSAGDTIGASPLLSAHYLDEPTITAMNLLGLEFNAVGNHEFDKGVPELQRIQSGGCEKHTQRQPCAVEPFTGARFQYLAANVRQADGTTPLPSSGIKRFTTPAGPITLGFIGMTLQATTSLVTPSGVRGVTFADEADTANQLVPQLKAAGANAIVLLIHQGGKLPEFTSGNGCEGLYGEILPILARLDPAITTVVSGHTHWAYVCTDQPAVGAGRLLTSAGKHGFLATDLRLRFDPATRRLTDQIATNLLVGTGERGKDAAVEALVARYAAAVAPIAERVIGRLAAPAPDSDEDWESPAANLIADATLAATRSAERGGAQLALVNATGVRVGLPAGEVRYKDAFAMMPFGNNLLVTTLTGAQLQAALERQYGKAPGGKATRPAALAGSAGLTYAVDLAQASGNRVWNVRLDGRPITPTGRYRVALNNYLAAGGDGLTELAKGTDIADCGIIDVDAFVAWIAQGATPPAADRIRLAAKRP